MAELPKEELFTGKGKGMSDVYCYVMKGSTLLLADERNKKHLLDLLLCAHRACSCPVYAFCVTDDAAYFITEAEDMYTLQMLQERVTERFWKIYEGFPDTEGTRWLRAQRIEAIRSMSEFARRCRAVHRLPLSLGYVRRIGDYWWSSYQNYQQGYHWGMVDCSVFLRIHRRPFTGCGCITGREGSGKSFRRKRIRLMILYMITKCRRRHDVRNGIS